MLLVKLFRKSSMGRIVVYAYRDGTHFFKGWLGAAFPTAHGILIALDGPLLRFLRDMPPLNADCAL